MVTDIVLANVVVNVFSQTVPVKTGDGSLHVSLPVKQAVRCLVSQCYSCWMYEACHIQPSASEHVLRSFCCFSLSSKIHSVCKPRCILCLFQLPKGPQSELLIYTICCSSCAYVGAVVVLPKAAVVGWFQHSMMFLEEISTMHGIRSYFPARSLTRNHPNQCPRSLLRAQQT